MFEKLELKNPKGEKSEKNNDIIKQNNYRSAA